VTAGTSDHRPRLVLVHGLGSSSAIWRPVLPGLARVVDPLLVELPGHGSEPWDGRPLPPSELAAHVGRAMDARGWDRAHLLGHSLGGWTVLEAAADGRALSVTALAPAGLWRSNGNPPSPSVHLNRAAGRLLAPLAPYALRSRAIRAVALASGSVNPGAVPYADAVAAAQAMRDADAYWAALEGTRLTHFLRAADVTVPVTAVWGDHDRILPAPGTQVRELMPAQSRWIVVPHCGHTPQWDAANTVVRHTLATISQAATPPR
jgi:pimeloyl-ACP methyl ester carboxylesterase